MNPSLRLLVLRCRDLEGSKRLYESFGLRFDPEQHGSGPMHWAAVLPDGLVVELYPSTQSEVDVPRLGFAVLDLAAALAAVVEAGGRIVAEHHDRAVVEDLDGRKIELST